jgi:1,4-alpha-glucan branching enzyme
VEKQAERIRPSMDSPPIIVSPYDAELFGHWWFEGPTFLNDVFRQIYHDQDSIRAVTPSDYLEWHPMNQAATPCASSWGKNGYNEQWLNETNAWTWRHTHAAGERMVELAQRHVNAVDQLEVRALKQAARELMLLQSSDWPFIMSTGTTVPYATRRFNDHVLQFDRLYHQIKGGAIETDHLAMLESRDNLFPDIDYRLYAT